MTMKVRDVMPNAENSTNFDVVTDSQTQVGTTLDNLKAAVQGETGASAKYAAFSKAAQEAGYEQIARQFAATSAAEQMVEWRAAICRFRLLSDTVSSSYRCKVPIPDRASASTA